MYDKRNDTIGRPITIRIERTIPHSDYDHQNKTNDIALIRLAEEVQYNDFVQPICLPSMEKFHNANEETTFEIGGWGNNGTGIWRDLYANRRILFDSIIQSVYT